MELLALERHPERVPHTTAVSLLDRLLHHANVVITADDSYRMRQARARGGTTLTKK